MDIQTAEKMCKSLAKDGISLHVENSPQESMLNGLMETYYKKYRSQYIRYADNTERPIKKQRLLDIELMEVPKDPIKKHIFFLEKTLELAKNNLKINNNNNEGIPNGFKKIIGKVVEYELVNNLDLTSSNQLLAIDNSIVKDVRRFAGCIVKRSKFSIYTSSFDLICPLPARPRWFCKWARCRGDCNITSLQIASQDINE